MTPTEALHEGMLMALIMAKVNGSPKHEHLGDLLRAAVPDTLEWLPEGWRLVGPETTALVEAALALDEVNRDMDSGGRHAEWWGKRNAYMHAIDAYRAALSADKEDER